MTCEVEDCVDDRDLFQRSSTPSDGFPVTDVVMSDGSSVTQISDCGSDQVVPIDSADSSSETNSDDNSRLDSSDSESIDSDHQSTSTDSCSVDLEDAKPPVAERIAKDTGCCLYSAITALVIMLVLLGIVLIVNGPVLGLSIPSLVRVNTPVPPVEHNYLVANESDINVHHEHFDYLDYHYTNETHHPVEFEDYQQDVGQLGESTTDHPVNETTEDLANLSPEALKLNPKYVAYVPIPIRDDEDDDIEEDANYFEETTNLENKEDEEMDHYDDVYNEDNVTPRSSSSRRRPEAVVDKLILPILMVPAESDRRKTSQGSDSWGSNDFADQRRYDDDDDDATHHDTLSDDHLKTSPSLRIPGLQRLRNRGGNKGRPRERDDGIDYRMFGSLAPESRRQQLRARLPYRGRQQDDYARTTSLNQDRIPSFRPTKNSRGREVDGQRNGPSIYIRPPPRPRNRNYQQRFRSSPWTPNGGQINRQRTIVSSTRKPPYSYPKDAMSIQDIISYMTSLSHSSESSTTNPVPVERKNVWNTESTYDTSRTRYDSSWPNVLPPPTRMTADSRLDSTIHLSRNGAGSSNPYSFKLDVYPIRDGVSGLRSGKPPGNSLRFSPTTSQRPQDYRQQYYTRQPSTASDSTGNLADIDYSYKVHIPEDNNKYPDPYRRPYDPSYRDALPVPASYRPRQPAREESSTPKPKLVVHLNVFNQNRDGNGYNRYGGDRRDEEGDYYSPSDVYRAVLKNNMANNRQDADANDDNNDDGLMGGQSRLSGYPSHMSTSDGSSSHRQDNLYENHNMSPTDNYYRSLRRQSGVSNSNYRRNHYPTDEAPELLPIPMAVTASDEGLKSTTLSSTEEHRSTEETPTSSR